MKLIKFANKLPIFIFLFLIPDTIRSQVQLLNSDSLYSNYLNEYRQFQVLLPDNYHQDKTKIYDVIYVLDGEWNTSLAITACQFLTYAKFVPSNLIFVSIPNKYVGEKNMRDRDFTPTYTDNSDGKFEWMRSSLISGGADKFMLFLENELLPYINSKYPINIENSVLYGTSLGGLLAIYVYINNPSLFKSYLTVEPSLWWDKQYISKIFPNKLDYLKNSKNTLWIGARDGNPYRDMGIAGFDSLLTRYSPSNLHWEIKSYSNETHFSAIWKGLYDGLKFTYAISPVTKEIVNKAELSKSFRLENGTYVTHSEMDEFLKTRMDSLGIPGLSFAIINDGKIAYYKTFGYKNVVSKEPINSEDVFDAASMTKPVFASLVLKMVEKGNLDLDKALYTYLPNSDIAYDNRYKLITARMVLSHTSGFPNWRFFNEDGKLDIKFTPGTKFLYSGEGYEYLADVVAHLLGIDKNSLQGVFNQEIGDSIGLDFTYFTWNDWLMKHRVSGHVDGNVSGGYGINKDNPNFYASHSMQTEAFNYANFLIGIMEGKILKKESINEMLTIQYPNAKEPNGDYWGLGVGIRKSEFGNQYFHGGFNKNFTSEFMMNIEQKFGYVFFTNNNNGSELNKAILKFFNENKN